MLPGVNRLLSAGLALLAAAEAFAQPVKVELAGPPGDPTLRRGGQAYVIKGAGGDASREVLRQLGGNSVRTWGTDDLGKQLDDAHALGLTVTAGIWMGHERHGFDYRDLDKVAAQYEAARDAVLKHKDHPALLMWAVGNEMEGYAEGDNAAVWSAVNSLAAEIKRVDPNHPTMTVVAEIGGKRVEAIHRLCPAVDVVGVNTYGGGASVAERYKAAGGTKPLVVTEFGPPGAWEVAKNAWGAPAELTSTQKAEAYRAVYERSIKQPNVLGSYAFAWGHKREATATWFGLFLPDGSRLEAVDALGELWSGKKPANRCPQIAAFMASVDKGKPGAKLRVQLDARDPERDALKIEYRLEADPALYATGGDAQAAPPTFPDAVKPVGTNEVEITLPASGGGYFLYAVARDGKGGAATATLPIFVDAPMLAPPAATAKLPFDIVADGAASGYAPSGWMGNAAGLAMDERSAVQPHSGPMCLAFTYKAADGFVAVAWQSPPNDWGDLPGGRDLTGATKLTFWARGERGGEKVEFKMGIYGPDKPFPDTASAALPAVTLTTEWQQHTIDLAGKDLSRVKTAFVWSLAGQGRAVTFYLDDVRYE